MAVREVGEFEYVYVLDGSTGQPVAFGGSSGGTSMTDDAAFTVGSSSVTPVGGIVTSDSVDSGDGGAFAMLANRQQKVTLYNSSASEITAWPVTDNSGSLTVDNNGTFAVQADGSVAHDGIDSGSPVKIGGKANSAVPTAVSAADRVDGWFGLNGQMVIAAGISNTNHTGTNGLGMIDTSGTPRPLAVGMYNGSNYDSIRGTTTNGIETNLKTINGTSPATGSGNATDALRVELPTNGTGRVGLNAGTNAIGKLAANSGVDIGDVDVTSISAGSNLIGDVGIQPRTGNGLTTFMASGSDGSSILVATAQVIKASAGKLYGYYAYNPEAAVSFVHFYNTAAASVTVGTTNPLFTLAIPAGAAANLMSEIGITFSNAGWSCAATTTAGGNTAPSTGVSLVAWYA